MKWKNAIKDKLPADKKKVLISVNGINYASTFCAEQKAFKITGEKETDFKVGEHMIYWTET